MWILNLSFLKNQLRRTYKSSLAWHLYLSLIRPNALKGKTVTDCTVTTRYWEGRGKLLKVTQWWWCSAAAVMPLRQHRAALKSFAVLTSGLDLLYKCCPGVLYHRLLLPSTPLHVIYSTAFLCTAIVKSVVDLADPSFRLILFTLLWLCSNVPVPLLTFSAPPLQHHSLTKQEWHLVTGSLSETPMWAINPVIPDLTDNS